jgi:class 3 adenylate cyclase
VRPTAWSPGPPGYLLRVAPGELDAARFAVLTGQAETTLAAGQPEVAAQQLDEALSLWHGTRWPAWTWRRSPGPRRPGWQAIRCAAALQDTAAAHGIEVRAGIHTGEVDLAGNGIAGTSVHIADEVAALAQPAEILVSRTVKDLVAGSSIGFISRGRHRLGGLPDGWPLFAVTRI